MNTATPKRFVIKHNGRQIGKPVRDIRVALQRSYDILADVDMNSLTKREKERLVHTIEEI